MTKTALIAVFLNTWGNYNENGADGGFWVNLPCNLDEVLEKLAKSTGEEIDEMEVFIMKEFWVTVQVIFAGIGGWLGWFLGGCDGLLYALLLFVVLDDLTGIMCAIVDRKLSSAIGFKGIFKKILIFALVGVGHILDTMVIGTGSVLRTAVIFFYLSNEGISLIENAGHLGLPIPAKLKAVLEQLHDRAEKEDK